MSPAFVIGYDITEPRRLSRVHRIMVQHAMPLEYSIFLFIGEERGAHDCIALVADLIDKRTDDVRCYPLPARGFQARLGKATLPNGIQWTGLPSRLG